MIFQLGMYAGIICAILWIFFDLKYLNKWRLFKGSNKWLKSSYRRGTVLTIAIIAGYFGILARALDMANALVAIIVITMIISTYNIIIITKNKAITRIRR